MRSLAFQLQQQLPPRFERPSPLLEVVVPVVDTFHAFELVVQAAFGHVRLHAEGCQVRAGAEVSNDELVRFASLFNDELTLDNLERCGML